MTGPMTPEAAPPVGLGPAPDRPPTQVSVVVPVRNGATTLGEALGRLVAERPGVSWELVVADNGSTDDTRTIAEGFASGATRDADADAPTVRVVDASRRTGPAHARNAGADVTTGELLCFTDADDLVEPGWLGALVAAAAGRHAVAGRLEVDTINPADARAARPRPVAARDQAPPFAPSCNLAIWDDVFTALGGFDEDLLANEDVDLSERLIAAGGSLGWAPDAVVHYRLRATATGIARQSFRSGWYAVVLAARHDPHGRTGRSVRDVLGRIGWLVVRLPYLAVRRRRGLWVHHGAALGGELAATAVLGWRRVTGGRLTRKGRT